MPIFIPDLFTSYINGRRQAVADNWQDLSNYNQIAAGQLNNAFNMATFDPRVRIAESQAQLGEQNTALGGATTDQALAQIALQNKYNVPQQKALAESSTYALQQAQTSALLDYIKNNPSAAALFFPGMQQYPFMQQPNNTSSTGGASGQTSTGGTSAQTPTGIPNPNTGK